MLSMRFSPCKPLGAAKSPAEDGTWGVLSGESANGQGAVFLACFKDFQRKYPTIIMVDTGANHSGR